MNGNLGPNQSGALEKLDGLFVTGTDTGVGKTFVSLALVAAWRDAGLRVGVMKPCETGCEDVGGHLVPEDATRLLKASRTALSLDEVCPCRFPTPMAPAEAAAVDGGAFDFERTAGIFRAIRGSHDVTLVEGAGGLLVPFAGERTTVDLIRVMAIPVLVVARIGLGTINHTCLTVECARAHGLDVLGVVFTRTDDPQNVTPGPDEARNPAAIRRLCGVEVLGNIPYIPGGDPRDAAEYLDSRLRESRKKTID
jgi:dethiobiotin synthetase